MTNKLTVLVDAGKTKGEGVKRRVDTISLRIATDFSLYLYFDSYVYNVRFLRLSANICEA